MPLEIAPGEFRTVESLHYDFSFGDSGHLAFSAFLSGQPQGIFVSSLVAVPEPSSLMLLGVLVVLQATLPRRRSH